MIAGAIDVWASDTDVMIAEVQRRLSYQCSYVVITGAKMFPYHRMVDDECGGLETSVLSTQSMKSYICMRKMWYVWVTYVL